MPKVTEEYIVNKKKRITDAAYELCLEKTVSTVTMQDIIDRTRFSQGGIYRFYKDIDDIFSDMIRQMRERVSIKEKIDEILGQKEVLTPQEITDRLFAMLADFMEMELMGIEKIDFELSVLAMNRPDRIEKIMGGIPEVGNMEYLTMRAMEYFKEQAALGRIRANMNAEELLAFISSAYGGIQMTCIVNNCYRHERNPLAALYQPRILLKMLAQAVNGLIGAKEDSGMDFRKEEEGQS
ncbi:MAG: TetR/AcrR family transcriptional regulator [Lachnospiraceae bacterium]|nr:TetR/AcrR family transcriptional regulator [Lachnospiraceae bacterium]